MKDIMMYIEMAIDHIRIMIDQRINKLVPDMIKTITLDIVKRVVADHILAHLKAEQEERDRQRKKRIDEDHEAAQERRAKERRQQNEMRMGIRNSGTIWSPYEEQILRNEVDTMLHSIARRHGRSVTVIRDKIHEELWRD